MEFIRFKNWMPKVVFNFRRGGSISQRRGFFAAKGHFCSPFHNCEMGVLCCEMALMCQSYGDFAAISQLRNEVTVLRNGTRVPRGGFATAKIFAEGGMGLRKSFRSQVAILQRRLDFAADLLGLRNHFAAKGRFCSGLLWATKFRRPILFPWF